MNTRKQELARRIRAAVIKDFGPEAEYGFLRQIDDSRAEVEINGSVEFVELQPDGTIEWALELY